VAARTPDPRAVRITISAGRRTWLLQPHWTRFPVETPARIEDEVHLPADKILFASSTRRLLL
jgi:hypothetical protein